MLLLLAGRAAAATLTVGPGASYATIGDAEAAASDGDTLQIAAGVYFELLDPRGKDLTYTSSAGATISAVDPCLQVWNGETVVVSGLTFDACSHAIVVSGSSAVTVEDTTFANNSCGVGCAVYAEDSATVTVTGATFSSNAASDHGGSIYAADTADVAVTDSAFAGGSATYGGEIAFVGTGTLTLTDVTFTAAEADYGGAVYATSGDLALDTVTFRRGSAYDGGGLWTYAAGVTLVDTVFDSNTATNEGGGACFGGGRVAGLSISGGRFSDNVAARYGGGLMVNDAEPVAITGTTFEGNAAASAGGAYVYGNTGTVHGTRLEEVRFVENEATSGDGGGLYGQDNSELELSACAFVGNVAAGNGGALRSADDAAWFGGTVFLENVAAGSGGGALLSVSGRADFENVAWACNTASYGAGLALTASAVALDGTLAVGNDAGGYAISTSSFTPTDNVAWDNGTSWVGVSDPTGSGGNLAVDPIVRALSCDGDWTNDDLAPDSGSPLLDVTSLTDADGSAGDIGAYGGPRGEVLDVDGDGWTYWDGDCHEGRADAFPGGTEAWYDGIDQDCDGRDDDQDADGYDLADDCDDEDAAVSPGTPEAWYDGTDQDCDGNDDDQDVDGYGVADDCDDLDAGVNPGVVEVWYDGTDQDCDGVDDDQDLDGYGLADDCDDLDAGVSPGVAEAWYDGVDQDCDGNDDDQDVDGYALADDCDDTDAAVNPGVAEAWYDGIDQDCDGNDLDQDGDGEGVFTDCDDTNAAAYPGATERWYDGVDQDCDGNDADQDGDGFDGGPDGDDCDDADAAVSPGAAEVWYDGIDQDCDDNDDDQDGDGFPLAYDCDDLDADVNPAAAETWYDGADQDCAGDDDFDQDGDGAASLTEGAGEDCDDTDAAVFPGATEAWYDGIDQDCDGNDSDQDGDGTPGADGDCDDTDAAVFPGATEAWYDGVDQDCDGRDDDQDGDGAVLADDCDDTDAAVLRCITRIDGGCNSSGASPTWLLVAAALLLVRRGTPLLALATPAWALDATGTGRVPTDAGGLQRAGGMVAGDAGNLDVALAAGFAGTTAEATYDDGSTAPLMGGLATAELGVGWTFLDGVRVEAGLPVVLGAAVPADLGPGIGDAWVSAQWAPVRGEAFSIGPAVEIAIPSGSAARLSGGGGVGGALMAAAGGTAGPVRWGAELGGGLRAAGSYERLTFTHEPELRAGGGARVTVAGPFSVGGEVIARVGFGAENAVALATSGAEGLLTAGLAFERVDVGLAGGVGLIDGVGTPDARVVLSVRSRLISAGPRAEDDDADGVADARDACPGEREDDDGFQDDDGCPDLDDDADGIPDSADRCASDPEDMDYVQDADGCPDLDDDADGLADTFDRCPREAGPAETNGCPDRDRDGKLDGADRCPDDAAIPGTDLTHNDGCPGRVVVFPDRLRLADPIPFDAGRATLRPEGLALVREVAAVLQQYPDLARVEIGAHVDDAGDDAASLKLTVARAEAVKKALVAAGVDASRLVTQGYGEARPIAPNDTEEDRAKNRRVELLLLGR